MSLLDLPPEILVLIAQHIGSKELRASADYLLISKAWYRVVLRVYLSGLNLSTIYVLSNDLERFPRPNTNIFLGRAIQERVTRLGLCLDGLPSINAQPWHEEGFSEDTNRWLDENVYYHRCGWNRSLQVRLKIIVANVEIQPGLRDFDQVGWNDLEVPFVYQNRFRDDETQEEKELEHRLSHWRDRLNNSLSMFAEILPACEELHEFKIETTLTPRWNYTFNSSVGRLLTRLPLNVMRFTLDVNASDLIHGEHSLESVHICAILSQRLQGFQTVRIRMRSICPCIFDTSTALPDTASRLKTLVIRLNLPNHTRALCYTHNGHHSDFHAKSCSPAENPLYQKMVSRGLQFAKTTPSMTALRISYKRSTSSMTLVADCRQERVFICPNNTEYKDQPVAEGPWEDTMNLLDEGPLIPGIGLLYE